MLLGVVCVIVPHVRRRGPASKGGRCKQQGGCGRLEGKGRASSVRRFTLCNLLLPLAAQTTPRHLGQLRQPMCGCHVHEASPISHLANCTAAARLHGCAATDRRGRGRCVVRCSSLGSSQLQAQAPVHHAFGLLSPPGPFGQAPSVAWPNNCRPAGGKPWMSCQGAEVD